MNVTNVLSFSAAREDGDGGDDNCTDVTIFKRYIASSYQRNFRKIL